EMRKSAGTAAEIDDSRTSAQSAQLDECIDEARARLRREYVILVRIGMGIEKRDLLTLVLLVAGRSGAPFVSRRKHGAPRSSVNGACRRRALLPARLRANSCQASPAAGPRCGRWIRRA